MANAHFEMTTRSRNRNWVKVSIASCSFTAVVLGAFYLGSHHSASPIGSAAQSAFIPETTANASQGAHDTGALACVPYAPNRPVSAADITCARNIMHAAGLTDAQIDDPNPPDAVRGRMLEVLAHEAQKTAAAVKAGLSNPPHISAVTIEAPLGAQTDPDDARAPVRSAQAPDVDSITSTKEGQAVLMHAVGMSDAQIDAATPAQIEAAKAAFKDTLARRAPSDNGCYDLDGKPVDVCE